MKKKSKLKSNLNHTIGDSKQGSDLNIVSPNLFWRIGIT